MAVPPDEPPLPWVLRRTNQLFIRHVRASLTAGGFGDLTQRGIWTVQLLHGQAHTASELVDALQVTKQAVSSLVEELVVGGYVRRDPDPADRRRTLLALTPRGVDAAVEIEQAVGEVERRFVEMVGAPSMARLRRTLTELLERPPTEPGG